MVGFGAPVLGHIHILGRIHIQAHRPAVRFPLQVPLMLSLPVIMSMVLLLTRAILDMSCTATPKEHASGTERGVAHNLPVWFPPVRHFRRLPTCMYNIFETTIALKRFLIVTKGTVWVTTQLQHVMKTWRGASAHQRAIGYLVELRPPIKTGVPIFSTGRHYMKTWR